MNKEMEGKRVTLLNAPRGGNLDIRLFITDKREGRRTNTSMDLAYLGTGKVHFQKVGENYNLTQGFEPLVVSRENSF